MTDSGEQPILVLPVFQATSDNAVQCFPDFHLCPRHRSSALRALPRHAGHSSRMGLPVSAGSTNTVTAWAGGKRTAHPAASSTAATLTATSSTPATSSRHGKPPCSCPGQDPPCNQNLKKKLTSLPLILGYLPTHFDVFQAYVQVTLIR
jgi:hypothetical protein